MSKEIEIDSSVKAEEFETQLTEELTVVRFSAPWCGPCRMLNVRIEGILEGADVAGIKVDTDVNPNIASKFGIRSIPTMILVAKDGSIVDAKTGAGESDQTLIDWIKGHKK